jgi:polysaccharide biosynthesis transport protein
MEPFNGNQENRQHFGLVPTFSSGVVVPPQRSEVAGSYDAYDRDGGSDSGGGVKYLRVLLRHKGKLCLFALGGIILGIAVGIPFTPIYRVRTSLEVLSLNKDFMNTNQTSPVATNDDSYETSEEETQAKLLQSDALIDRVFNKFDPGLVYIRHNPRIAESGWRHLLNMPPHTEYTDRQKLLLGLADSLKVKADPRTRVIEVTARSTDAKLTTDFVNSLANEYIGQAIEARLRTTEKIGDWLAREMDSTRAKLEHSEAALQMYAGKSGLIFTTTHSTPTGSTTSDDENIETEKLQQIQQALTTQIADRVAKEARNELAQNAPADSLADVLTDDNLRTAQAAAVDAARQVADLSAVFTPDFVKVKRMAAQQATLQAAYEQQRADVIARIKNDYTEALQKEKFLEVAYDKQAREVIGQDEKAIQYNILKRDVDGNRQLYDTMMQQLEQSSVASALHASNARIFDPATLPQKPIWPNYLILAPLGLLFGLGAGLWAVMIIERMDRSLRQPGEIQLWTNLPELGTIPSASIDPAKKVRIKVLTGVADPVRRGPINGDKKVDRNVELVTFLRKPSMLAEAFRATLTSILFVGQNGTRPRVVALTSANASDGKTTVTTNLAIAMAEVRGNVLVIDGDLRRPRLHDLFELPNDVGLNDLLREQTLSPEVIAKYIQQSRVPGLAVLTSGKPTHVSANLLHSANLGDLIDKLKDQYDMVLIDTPPMLQLADARLIGRHADAMVLVARAGKTTRDAIVAAYQRLAEDRIPVLGTVLNDWNPKRSPAGYYGYYRAYGYGSYKTHYGESVN